MTQTVWLCSGGANISDSLVYILFVGVGGGGSYNSQKSVVELNTWFYPQHLVAVGIF